MPDFLHITPSDLDSKEKRGKYTVCILGCDSYGMILAATFAEAGFKIICADQDQSLIRRIKKRKSGFSQGNLGAKIKDFISSGILMATSDLKNAIMSSDTIILTTPAKIDEERNTDFSNVEKNLKKIGEEMSRGVLVVYANVSSFGFIENVAMEMLERTSGLKTGQDFGLACITGLKETYTESNQATEVIIAANEKNSLDAAQIIFSTILDKGMKLAINLKAAELAALFSSARKEVAKALTNELAILCEKARVDYYQTLNLVNIDKQKCDNFLPGVDSHTSRIGTRVLLENADNLGVKLRLTELGKHVNDDMVKHGVSLTREALRRVDKTFKRARIAVLGSGLDSSFEAFSKMIETKGARVSLYESSGEWSGFEGTPALKRSIIEAIESSDCVVFLTKEEQFLRLNLKNLRAIMRTPAVIVDLARVFEPEKVESEGFLYASLGRGG